ncbi:unnamed protein product [Malus baccata var. baccata]
MSKSWIRHGYNKVARIVSRAADPKKQNFPVLEGHPVTQEHAERVVESHDTIRKKDQVLKEFRIYRWSLDHPNNKPYLHSYCMRTADRNHQVIETEEACGISTSNTAKKGRHREGGGVITRAGENIGTLRTFWVKGKSRLRLKKVVDRSGEGIHGRQKNMQMKVWKRDIADGWVTAEGYAGEGICGSCSMNIDETNTVACLRTIDADTSKATTITPLPYMFVSKDLVVDLTNFYQLIEPWLKTTKPPKDGREYRQSPADRKKLDGLYECILCACCTTSCPSYWWNPEDLCICVMDWCLFGSRDKFTEPQLQALTEDPTCPKNLNPAGAINKMKNKHLSQPVEMVEDQGYVVSTRPVG